MHIFAHGVQNQANDCADVMAKGNYQSGVYSVRIDNKDEDVFCDMETDGGAWTVSSLLSMRYISISSS